MNQRFILILLLAVMVLQPMMAKQIGGWNPFPTAPVLRPAPLKLAWDASKYPVLGHPNTQPVHPGAIHYTLWFGPSKTEMTNSVEAGGALHWIVYGLKPKTSYFFSVRASNSTTKEVSAHSNIIHYV